MRKGEKTHDPRQAWITAALVLGVAVFFGAVVLPYAKPAKSALVGAAAPDFALPVLHNGEPGNRMRLSDQKGRAVLIDFWASWCAPCRAQAPILDAVARRWDTSKVVVIGVNTNDDQKAALDFARQAELSYTSLHDAGGAVATSFGVRELPTLVVVDTQGRVSAVKTRVVREKEVERLVREALGQPEEAS